MKTNSVREKLRAGKPSIGCYLGLGSPAVAELLAHAGFEWLIVETEHNALDMAQVEHMLMAMNGTEAVPLVRVPPAQPDFIQRALDIGALGVVVPLVKTLAEVQAVVAATRYPPRGTRSFGPLRASRYMLDSQDYFNRADDNILVVLILETREAVQDLEAITAVPGVDAIYLGLFDLCLSLGLNPMHMPFPEIDRIVERALAVGQANGVAVGTGASTPEELRQRQAQGFTMIGYGPDYRMIADAARAGLAAFVRQAPGMIV
jgi:4-hydroxy-2-oxoheptanedioate aldolase